MTVNPALRVPTNPDEPLAIALKDTQQRLERLERTAGQPPPPVGFYVVRTSSEAIWATGSLTQLTWTNIRSNKGFIPSTWAGGPTFVVPDAMGGLYNVGAGVYWSVALAGVYVAIRVNNNVVLGHDAGHLADRRYLGAQPVLLQEGDVIDVVLWNLSDGDVQVTSYPGDGLASPPLPYLTVWRV